MQNSSSLGRTIRIERRLSSGGFGRVFQATHIPTGRPLAVKLLVSGPGAAREASILSYLRDKGPFVMFIGVFEAEPGVSALALELLGAPLHEAVKTNSHFWFQKRKVYTQTLQCLERLHELGIMHRDIKPGNFCVGLMGSQKRKVKLVDFGLAVQVEGETDEVRKPGFVGTAHFASPFVHNGFEYCFLDDMISLFYVWVDLSIGLPWRELTTLESVFEVKAKTKLASLGQAVGGPIEKVGIWLGALCFHPEARIQPLDFTTLYSLLGEEKSC